MTDLRDMRQAQAFAAAGLKIKPGERAEEKGQEQRGDGKANSHADQPDIRSLYWTLDDIENLEPPEWLVEELIPRRAKALIFGESGHYKSIHMVDMFCRAAHGMDYHGVRAKTFPVCFVANEDAYGLAKHHVLGWHRYYGKPTGRAIVIPGNVKLDNAEDVQKIVAAARDAFGEERPVFVIDTWDRSLNGDQNQTSDVNPGLTGLDALLAAAEATVTISHSPWSDKNRTKGSVTFWANHDTRLRAEKDEVTERGTIVVKHQKHAKNGFMVHFELELYEFDARNGAKATTLIPQRVHDAPAQEVNKPNGKARDRLNDEQTLALQALREEAESTRCWDFPFADAQAIWVRRDAISDDLDEEAQRKRSWRLRQQLAKRGLIKLDGQLIRLVLPS